MERPLFTLFIALLLPMVTAVKVINLQPGGNFSQSSYIKLENTLQGDLENFTVCTWVNMAYMRGGWKIYFFSYAFGDHDNEFTGTLQAESTTGSMASTDWKVKFEVCKDKFFTGDCAVFNIDSSPFNTWTHLCGVFYIGNKGENQTYWRHSRLYLNGAEGALSSVHLEDPKHRALKSGGILIIGQEQDTLGGGFDVEQSFCGYVTEFNVWNRVVSKKEIGDMARCQEAQQGNVLTWTNSNWEYRETIEKDIPLGDLCAISPLSDKLILIQKSSYNEVKPICDVAGGHLPTPKSPEETNKLMEEMLKATKGYLPNGLCQDPQKPFVMVVGLKYSDNQGKWINIYTNNTPALVPSEHNRQMLKANCAVTVQSGIDVSKCDWHFGCGVCLMKKQSYFHLKGICKANIEQIKWFDFFYYSYGFHNLKPHFRGITNSHIYFDDENLTWRLQSLRDTSKYLLLLDRMPGVLPFGRQKWVLGSDLSVCAKAEGMEHNLTFSRCALEEFTCDNGFCIPLRNRCDTEFNCADQSDEFGCNHLKIDRYYNKELAPPFRNPSLDISEDALSSIDVHGHGHDLATVVYLNISIQALPSIDTVNLKFTVDFFLQLSWHDGRLSFRNLNQEAQLNRLSSFELNNIWVPELLFMNALGSLQTKVDETTAAYIKREGNSSRESYEEYVEASIYDGNTNSISVNREYFFDLSCNFDLMYYPFDTQVCVIDLETPWGSGFKINIPSEENEPNRGITISSEISLLEYEILGQRLNIYDTEKGHAARAVVKLVIRRRMEYHLTSTFMQTLILIGVGFMSLFFKEDNFTDRIMVSITNLVVVATITSSVQQNLPKTYYFKLIDWWLVFCLNILVVLMTFHTYLAAVKQQQKMQCLKQAKVRQTVKSKKVCMKDNYSSFQRLVWLNRVAKLIIAGIIVLFNVIFWAIALKEYTKSYEQWLEH